MVASILPADPAELSAKKEFLTYNFPEDEIAPPVCFSETNFSGRSFLAINNATNDGVIVEMSLPVAIVNDLSVSMVLPEMPIVAER